MSAEFIESQRQFAIALEAARSIRVRVWSVYRLDPYDEFGAQGTRFVFQHAKPTRDEAFESVSGPKPAFAVEENLAADGTRWYLTSSEDSRVHNNGGPMNNVNLLDGTPLKSAEGYVYDGKNQWVRATIKSNGISSFQAEARATGSKPKGWKEPEHRKHGIYVSFNTFPDYDEDDSSDEEEEEDYDY